MEAGFIVKAEDFMKQGDKKLKGGFVSNIFGSKADRLDEACELYKQAAVNFKLAKQWEAASKSYIRCAECELQNKSNDAAEYYSEASNMIKKVNNAESIKLMEKAIELYCQDNRISYAAKLKKSIAETYESDGEYSLAAKSYQEAADFFYAESDNTINYLQALLKVADLNTVKAETNFTESISIYEKVADKYLENKLLAPSARELFFKSALLNLANDDTIGCQNAIEKYVDKDPTFQNSRECKFVLNILKAIEEKSLQKFSDLCYNHNEIIPFDKWKLNILNKVKSLLENSIKGSTSIL